MKKGVLYARVSSKDQEKEGFSIPAQIKYLREYAHNAGIMITREFTDVETAKKAGRTNFLKMIQYLKAVGDTKIIVVEKTDRLYRNFRDYVDLDDQDLEIHLVKEAGVLSRDSRSHEKFIHGIKVLMAKNYIDNLSEEVKKGMTEKAEQGVYPSKAKFGYANVNKNIIINEAEAVVVRSLYSWHSTGMYSFKELRRKCKAEGYLQEQSRFKGCISHIEKILKDPFYYGDFTWNGIVRKGSHTPLVDKGLWDAVQDVIEARSNHKKEQVTCSLYIEV